MRGDGEKGRGGGRRVPDFVLSPPSGHMGRGGGRHHFLREEEKTKGEGGGWLQETDGGKENRRERGPLLFPPCLHCSNRDVTPKGSQPTKKPTQPGAEGTPPRRVKSKERSGGGGGKVTSSSSLFRASLSLPLGEKGEGEREGGRGGGKEEESPFFSIFLPFVLPSSSLGPQLSPTQQSAARSNF